jgi:hypothetical protein
LELRWGRISRYYIECASDHAITLMPQLEMRKQPPHRGRVSLIGFFRAPHGMEYNFASEDVVLEAILPPPDAPLTLARS